MILNLITSTILISSLSTSPLTIGLIVIGYSLIMLAFITNSISSIIIILIFLIYIGGLIVIFSYFLSLQPNFSIDSYPIILSLILNFIYIRNIKDPNLRSISSSSEKISTILFTSKFEILFLLTFRLLFTLVIVATLLSKF